MAKQHSLNDPVSAAMSAIESALNLGESDALASAEGAAPVPPLAPRKPAAAGPVLKPGVPPAEPAPLLRPGPTPPPSGAEAEAKATTFVSDAISRGNIQAINYFVAQRYIDAIGRLAGTPNQKVILMPLESASMIGSLAGIAEVARESFGAPRPLPNPAAAGPPETR